MAIILLVFVAAGPWLKPPLQGMRDGLGEGLKEYARAHLQPGETMLEVTHQAAHDWALAVGHVARAGDKTFYCGGAFKVTICDFKN